MVSKLLPDFEAFEDRDVQNPTLRWILSGFSENWEGDVKALKGVWASKSREFLARSTGMRAPKTGFPFTVQLDWKGQFVSLIEQHYPNLDFRELVALKRFAAATDELLTHTHAKDPTRWVIEAVGRAATDRLSGYNLDKIVDVLFHGFRRTPEADLFGAYRLDTGHVYVFLMPCIVFGVLANVKFLDVAIPTLAHELAHAYCHRGRDQDSAEWKVYREVEPDLSESLAEYYAWRFSEEALSLIEES